MPTTIQVSSTTKQLLELIKKEEGARNYDFLLKELALNHKKIPKSFFGKGKGLVWKAEDRMEDRDI